MLKCTYPNCNRTLNNREALIEHIAVHSNNANFQIKCPFNCPSNFLCYQKFKIHAKKEHRITETNTEIRTYNETYCCNYDLCEGQIFHSRIELINHLDTHRSDLNCLYCDYNTKKIKTYNSHLSTYHRNDTYLQIKEEFRVVKNKFFDDENEAMDTYSPFENNINANQPVGNDFTVEDEMNDLYQTTYMKYNSVNLIPAYVCDQIFNDMNAFVSLNNRDIVEMVKLLSKDKPELAAFSNAIISNIEIAGTFERVHLNNKSDLASLTWKRKTKMYVEPVEISLPGGEKFHYIPILKNIQALLRNLEINSEYFKEKDTTEADLIDSFEKSQKFKEWLRGGLDKNSVQIKLFIDAFTNVLGDGRKKYKQQGVYYKINNFDKSLGSKNYYTQLAVLFDNELVAKYGYEIILKCLIDDIKILESEGIEVVVTYEQPTEQNIEPKKINLKGSIIYVCADNLGANSVCGLIENFGTQTNGIYIYYFSSYSFFT